MRGAGPRQRLNKTMIYKITAALQSLMKRLKLQNRYRPERHYMRGPGPKARAIAASQSRH